MALLTIQGASAGMTIQVTVDGSTAGPIASLLDGFSANLSSAISGGTVVGTDVASGSFSPSGTVAGYAVVTTGGSYQLSGDISYVGFGAEGGSSAATFSSLIDGRGISASSVSVEGGTTGGITYLAGSGAGTFVVGTGDNTFVGSADANAAAWSIYTGGGANLIYLTAAGNQVVSYGADTISGASTVGQSVTIDGGSSFISVGTGSFVNDQATGDSITVGGASTVVGGTSGSIMINGTAGTVLGGMSDTISASGSVTVIGGTSANISVSGALTFLNGVGTTTITGSSALLFGQAGLDAVLKTTTSGSGVFVAGAGNETLDGSSSAYGIEAYGNVSGYTGTQTFIGGTGADTLVAGIGNATLTGGSGAANEFIFRDGIAGASYTITDFSAAAGNQVVLATGFTQADVTSAVASQVTTGSNTVITLSDSSQITFMNVTHLTAANFTIFS